MPATLTAKADGRRVGSDLDEARASHEPLHKQVEGMELCLRTSDER